MRSKPYDERKVRKQVKDRMKKGKKIAAVFLCMAVLVSFHNPVRAEDTEEKNEKTNEKNIMTIEKNSITQDNDDEQLVSTPRLMVTGYKTEKKTITPGKTFDLSVKFKNYSPKTVKNIKITMTTEQGEFVPKGGSTALYLDVLGAGEEKSVFYRLSASTTLLEQSYPITFMMEYEDEKAHPFSGTDTLYLPVSLKQRVSVTDVVCVEDVTVGDQAEITGTVNNLGAGTLYNVNVKVCGRNVEESTGYVGNIESGKSGNIDVLAKAVTSSKEADQNYMIVSYEDSKGKVSKKKTSIHLLVSSPNYKNLEKVKGGSEKKSYGNIVKWTVIGALPVIFMAAWWIRRIRRKKKIMEEFS